MLIYHITSLESKSMWLNTFYRQENWKPAWQSGLPRAVAKVAPRGQNSALVVGYEALTFVWKGGRSLLLTSIVFATYCVLSPCQSCTPSSPSPLPTWLLLPRHVRALPWPPISLQRREQHQYRLTGDKRKLWLGVQVRVSICVQKSVSVSVWECVCVRECEERLCMRGLRMCV